MSIVNASLTAEQSALWIDQERLRFKVSRRSFMDPAILQQEYRTIFEKCWLYIGH
ncbi:MAG: p-cumate dioxygenase, partial [Nevskia sp.]|nr:p-cumate dioxygenase [Nevskia sp.]